MSGIGEGQDAGLGENIACIGYNHGLGAIRLKLKLNYSQVGEFWSHFSPEIPPGVQPQGFDLDLLYGNIFKFLDVVYPILNVIWSIMSIVYWENVLVSWIWFIILISLTYYPGYIPTAFHLLLLRTIFLHRVDKIKSDSEEVVEMQERRNAGSAVEEDNDKKEATLGWITSVTKILPIPAHTVDTLRWLQNLLGGKAETISCFYDLWLWKSENVTYNLGVGIAVSGVVHLPQICNFWTIIYVEIIFIFFATTSYFKVLSGIISGLISYLTGSLSRSNASLAGQRIMNCTVVKCPYTSCGEHLQGSGTTQYNGLEDAAKQIEAAGHTLGVKCKKIQHCKKTGKLYYYASGSVNGKGGSEIWHVTASAMTPEKAAVGKME